MNYFQRIVKSNLNSFVKDNVQSILIIPNKRNKMYKLNNGKLITHRALIKIIRLKMKEKYKNLYSERNN